MQSPSDNGASAGAKPSRLPKFDASNLFDFSKLDLPTGEEIYDRLMGAIEPELTSKSVSGLKEKYKGETPEQKQQRAARYAKAYAEYETRYAQFKTDRDGAMHRYKAEALKSLEDVEKAQEHADVADLEAQMLSA